MTQFDPLAVTASLAIGAALGALYLLLLRRAVASHVAGAAPGVTVLLSLARIALAVAVFWGIARLGAAPLVSALLGFVLARLALTRRLRDAR